MSKYMVFELPIAFREDEPLQVGEELTYAGEANNIKQAYSRVLELGGEERAIIVEQVAVCINEDKEIQDAL